MRIGIDIDGVVCDVLTPWLNRCNAAQREKYKNASGAMPHMDWMPEDITEFSFWNQIGMSEADVWALFTPDIYKQALPYTNAKKVVDAIIELGHSVTFVTSCRTMDEFDAKTKWLQRHEMWKYTNGCYGVGELFFHKSKATAPIDWLIDDGIFNLETFPGYGILLTRPWNQQYIYPGKRIKALVDVLPLLRYKKAAVPQADGDEGALEQYASERNPMAAGVYDGAGVRQFATGATRDTDQGKLDYEGFLSSTVLTKADEYLERQRNLAWAAGLFEGEGCITIQKSKLKTGLKEYPRLRMTHTDEDVIRRFQQIMGGKIQGPYFAKGKKPCWYWNACSPEDVSRIATELLPYLGTRRSARFVEVLGVKNYAIAAGFLPDALEQFAIFMHKNRLQKDGSIRASDNWQKGIPLDVYMKSGYRHFMSWWKAHRGGLPFTEEQIDELCALLFNVQGYLHETLKAKGNGPTEQSAA